MITGASQTALANRIRTVAELSREHWAPQRRIISYSSVDADGDFYLDFTDRIPLVMTTLEHLQHYGPSGPVWLRIDGHHRAEGEPPLHALTDIRTEAEFRHRQTQREDAARAAEAVKERRKEAEERRRDAQWAREDWMAGRKVKTEELARLWNTATT